MEGVQAIELRLELQTQLYLFLVRFYILVYLFL